MQVLGHRPASQRGPPVLHGATPAVELEFGEVNPQLEACAEGAAHLEWLVDEETEGWTL